MAFCWGCPRSRLNIYRHCKMLLQELKWNVKKQVMSVPFLGSFIDFQFRNGSATNFSLLHTGQFRLIFPIDKLLIFSDQHLDLSLMYTDPGILGWSNMTSKPSGMSLPPSWMSSSRASRGIHSVFQGESLGELYTFLVWMSLVALACESLHVCAVYIWHCEHAMFWVEVFMRNTYSFIHHFSGYSKTCCVKASCLFSHVILEHGESAQKQTVALYSCHCEVPWDHLEMFDIQKTKQNKKEPKIVEINVYNITLSILCWDKGLFLPVFFICLFFFSWTVGEWLVNSFGFQLLGISNMDC